MHKINVLVLGSVNFTTSLKELKEHLNFKMTFADKELDSKNIKDYDVLIHEDKSSEIEAFKDILKIFDKIVILASNSKKIFDHSNETIVLPTRISEFNKIVENAIIKKNFNSNSSITIKNYILNKNEKKLVKDANHVLLTEKEIQLLELFLSNTQPISKKKILEKVWKYSVSADTHTVETHIYRLRKKINSKFLDSSFILNNKDGYTL
jgi:DNA-binding CsgD family transcriptional regulator